jgi:hypothetical protein
VPSVLTGCIFPSEPDKIILLDGTVCTGMCTADPPAANLGDGNGWVNQTLELRQEYDHLEVMGSEDLAGGNDLRLFRQNGTKANTGALFLAYVYQFFFSA